MLPVATFSIVGYDPDTAELGVAVQSKFIAVGAVVPWARAGIGAVATQAWANTTYGPDGLRFLADGLSPQDTLDRLTGADPKAAQRQAGIVDAQGRTATFTGPECNEWAGGRTGPSYAAQGNILAGPAVVDAMATAFEGTAGRPLSERLLSALVAGQAEGGDRRGMQSAALLVVREGAGYGGHNDRYLDLRVDDHPSPIEELQRIHDLYTLYFPPAGRRDVVPLDAALTRELQELLAGSGDYTAAPTGHYDAATRAALATYMGRENLEQRAVEGADAIDAVVLRYMREHR